MSGSSGAQNVLALDTQRGHAWQPVLTPASALTTEVGGSFASTT